MMLPGARAKGGALVGTNLLMVAQFPTGIDQPGIFIDFAGLFASKIAPTFGMRSPYGSELAREGSRPDNINLTESGESAYPTLAHLPHVS